MLVLNDIILAIRQGYDDLIILTSFRPVYKAGCSGKNLDLLVGITSLKVVMVVTGELFHLSEEKKPKTTNRGNDVVFWHPLVFSVAVV